MKKPKNKLWLYARENICSELRIIVIWPDGKIAKINVNRELGKPWFAMPCYSEKEVKLKNPMFCHPDSVGKFPTRKAAIKAMNDYDKYNKPIYIGAI